MSLTIHCPRCDTALRLDPTHITASRGWARCGQCQHVFDAGQLSLPTLAPSDDDAVSPPAVATAEVAPSRPQVQPTVPTASAPETVEASLTEQASAADPIDVTAPPAIDQAPADASASASASESTSGPAPEAFAAPSIDLNLSPESLRPAIDTEGPSRPGPWLASSPEADLNRSDDADPSMGSWLDASPLDDGPVAPTAGPQDSGRHEPREMSRLRNDPTWLAAPPPQVSPHFDPRQAWPDSPAPRPWGRWIGLLIAVALVVVVLAQAAFHQRHHIAARWPQFQGLLASACAQLGCELEAVERIRDLQVAHSAVVRLQNTHFQMDLEVRNDGDLAVRTPQLELSLQDAEGHTWARRLMPLVIVGEPAVLAAHTRYAAQVNWRTSAQDATRVDAYQVRLVYPSSKDS